MRGDDEIGFVDFCVGDLPYDETVAGWFEALICIFNWFFFTETFWSNLQGLA